MDMEEAWQRLMRQEKWQLVESGAKHCFGENTGNKHQ